ARLARRLAPPSRQKAERPAEAGLSDVACVRRYGVGTYTTSCVLPWQLAAPIASVALPDEPFGSTQTTVVWVLMGGPCGPVGPALPSWPSLPSWPGAPVLPS